jgi:modification methylase
MALELDKIYNMDVLEGLRQLENNSIDCVITSPLYNKLGLLQGKKQKGGDWDGFITYENFDDNMSEEVYQNWQIEILNEVGRILKPKGSFFYNHKNRRYDKREYSPNDWVGRSNLNIYQTIIWDRKADVNNSLYFFQPVYELVYWLNKSNKETPKFFKRRLTQQQSIWRISPKANIPHPGPFPEELVEQCILATTDEGDIVLDPFMGSGTTAVVAKRLNRRYIGFDLSDNYTKMATENVELGKIRKKSEI